MDLPQLSSHGPSRPLNMSIKWVQFDTDSSTHGLSWTHVMAHAAGLRCLRWIWMLPSFLAAKKSPLSRWDVVLFSPAQVGGGWCSKHHSATQNTVLQTLATFENGGPAKPVESVEMNLNRTGTWTDKKSPIDFVVRWGCVAQTYQNFVYKDPQGAQTQTFLQTNMDDGWSRDLFARLCRPPTSRLWTWLEAQRLTPNNFCSNISGATSSRELKNTSQIQPTQFSSDGNHWEHSR